MMVKGRNKSASLAKTKPKSAIGLGQRRKRRAISIQLKGHRSPLILARTRGISAREKLKKEEGGSISLPEAIRRLKMSRTELLKRYDDRMIVGWRDGARLRFPVWQFSNSGMLPGIERVLQALRETSWTDDWGLMLFFLGSRESLSGHRPLDLIREGRIQQALKYVHAYD